MADEIDSAAGLYEAERTSMVERARAAASRPGPPHNGRCYSCEEAIPAPKIFCDGDCADDFHARKRRR